MKKADRGEKEDAAAWEGRSDRPERREGPDGKAPYLKEARDREERAALLRRSWEEAHDVASRMEPERTA